MFGPNIAFVCKSRSYQSTANSYFHYSQTERSSDLCVFVNTAIFSIILTEFGYCPACVTKMSTAFRRPDLPYLPRPGIETRKFWGAHQSRFSHFVVLPEDGGVYLLLTCLLTYSLHGAESFLRSKPVLS